MTFTGTKELAEDRFIVVCADSTGHGVPGAFMSMIGTTLIKDICLRSGITKPSQVLTTLDNEVRESLNQNMETSGSNDGMDIIVAEIDMKNYNSYSQLCHATCDCLFRGRTDLY